MPKKVDPRYFNNLVDANALDVNADNPLQVVTELLRLATDGAITLLMPHSVKAEIGHPNTPADVKRRAMELIFTEPVQLTPNEQALHTKVRAIIQGNAQPGQHDRDAYHLVESAKYGGYFITNDRRLLNYRTALESLPGILVVTPTEFLAVCRSYGLGAP